MSRAALVSLVLLVACDAKPSVETSPAAVPLAETPGKPSPVASDDAPIDPGTLHIEAMTRTLWRIDEPVLTEITLDVIAGRIACGAAKDGCALDTLPDDSVLLRLGIERGDVLREIAGVAIGDGAALRRAIHRGQADRMLAVTLVRGSETRVHRYRIRDLKPASAAIENRERWLDLLAEVLQQQADDRWWIDAAALDDLIEALDHNRSKALVMLGCGEDAKITGIEGNTDPLAIESNIGALRPAPGEPLDLIVATSTPEAGTRTITIEPRTDLVDPALITALRAYRAEPRPSLPTRTRDPLATADPGAMYPGVTEVSDTEHTITRKLFDEILADPSALMKMARIIPDKDGGGMKLFGIRAGTVDRLTLRQLGFMNGDLVRSINGDALANVDAVLELYTKAKKTDRWVFEVERRGAVVTLTLRVVD
ncbi:MAG TPA: hypothetical protein VG755_17550 [Nannocystaceae bacterium]|nr:hypothetical protein [Nannocystaceae bacterium]